ncbi:hypothetical protein GGR09_001152 [Bartonella heixiaziensis]
MIQTLHLVKGNKKAQIISNKGYVQLHEEKGRGPKLYLGPSFPLKKTSQNDTEYLYKECTLIEDFFKKPNYFRYGF